jgi:hypothetical protein
MISLAPSSKRLYSSPSRRHDDLIDGCARVYDMKPVAPQPWERAAWEAPVHPDA